MTSEPPVVAQLLGWAAIGFLLLLALLVGIASEAVRKGRLPVARRRRLRDRPWRDTCDLCGAPTHDSALCDTCAWDVARDAEDQRQHEAGRDAR